MQGRTSGVCFSLIPAYVLLFFYITPIKSLSRKSNRPFNRLPETRHSRAYFHQSRPPPQNLLVIAAVSLSGAWSSWRRSPSLHSTSQPQMKEEASLPNNPTTIRAGGDNKQDLGNVRKTNRSAAGTTLRSGCSEGLYFLRVFNCGSLPIRRHAAGCGGEETNGVRSESERNATPRRIFGLTYFLLTVTTCMFHIYYG